MDATFQARSIGARFGLVGFGERDDSNSPTYYDDDVDRFAHSQLVDGDLFTDDVDQLIAGLGQLAHYGGEEDGWDAIDHAIAEYEFDDGAVPVFVLVQNEEARAPLNRTLTRDGIFAALRSKSVILNLMVVGDNLILPNGTAAFDSTKRFASPSRALAA